MAAVWKISSLVLLHVLFLNNVSAQRNVQNIPVSQIRNVQYSSQPLLSALLAPYTSSMPFVDKIGAIASVIQNMPAKPGRGNQRQYMAEALRQSAFESLMIAANACKCCGTKADGGFPLPTSPVSVANDVIGNRQVKYKYV